MTKFPRTEDEPRKGARGVMSHLPVSQLRYGNGPNLWTSRVLIMAVKVSRRMRSARLPFCAMEYDAVWWQKDEPERS